MTVGELFEYLQSAIEGGDVSEDAEVVIEQQESYPLKGDLVAICTENDLRTVDNDDKDEEDCQLLEPAENTLHLCSGMAREYGDKNAWTFR